MNRPDDRITELLVEAGVSPTAQRQAIAAVLFERNAHMTAEQVFERVCAASPAVSRATVYNTLALFVEKGLIGELNLSPDRTIYDSNTEAHHHLYDTGTGQITDIAADGVSVKGCPDLPEGKALDRVEIIFRVRDA